MVAPAGSTTRGVVVATIPTKTEAGAEARHLTPVIRGPSVRTCLPPFLRLAIAPHHGSQVRR
jgi:hypothetical protein